MPLFQNLASRFCGHEQTLADLNAEIVERGSVIRRRDSLISDMEISLASNYHLNRQIEQERDTALNQVAAVTAERDAAQATILKLRDEAQGLTLQRDLAEKKLDVITEQRDGAMQFSADLQLQLEAAMQEAQTAMANETGAAAALKLLERKFDQAQADLAAAHDQIAQLSARSFGDGDSRTQMHLVDSPAIEPAAPPAAEDRLISDSTSEQAWQLIGVFFIDRKYWILGQDGGRVKISASIKDAEFLARAHRREIGFHFGDYLNVRLQTVSWQRPNGTGYSRYTVHEVLGVIEPPEQLALPAAEVANA